MLRFVNSLAIVEFFCCIAVCQSTDSVPINRAPVQAKVVTGSPFSAEGVTEAIQVLADGNRIVHKSTIFIARDSEGRTRREQKVSGTDLAHTDGGDRSVVFIQDPPSGVAYVLEADSRIARRLVLARVDAPDLPSGDRPLGNRIRQGMDINTESLGTQVVEGLVAQGTRLTRTVSSSQMGNEKPFQVITETWYCPELQTLLMSKTTDPRTGETLYRLTKILREEPASSLFDVPTDYRIREEFSGLGLRNKEKAGGR